MMNYPLAKVIADHGENWQDKISRDKYRVVGNRVFLATENPFYKPFGLGDAVAAIARPIAGAIDTVAHTNIRGCGGCKTRRTGLNNMLPNIIVLPKKSTKE